MENRYSQNKDESAEILRLILQKMSKHTAAFAPPTYAVWYEHLAGINPQLSEEMNQLLNTKEDISDVVAERLFTQHISEVNLEAQDKFRLSIQKLLDGMARQAELTREGTTRFSKDLNQFGDGLNEKPDAQLLHQLVDAVMQGTQLMQGSVSSLHDKLIASKSKIEKLQRELQSAKSEALTDPLTQVLNRRGFDIQMKKLIANPDFNGQHASFLMLDIDFFKKINDSYGHLFGDSVLCGIATSLTAHVKGRDTVARLGGEEFAIILPDTPTQGAFILAEQIRRSIERVKIRRSGKHEDVGGITISIGIADCANSDDWKNTLGQADRALYVSKKTGRNKTTIYDDTMETPA